MSAYRQSRAASNGGQLACGYRCSYRSFNAKTSNLAGSFETVGPAID